MNPITRHFRRHLARGPWQFAWRIGVESTVASMVAAIALSLFFGIAEQRGLLDLSITELFIAAILLAPPLETLLLQALPIFIVRRLGGSIPTQILVSTIIFAGLHFLEGIGTGISAGVMGGFYFAFAYAHWRTRSRWKALWVTTACHAVHNAIAFVLIAFAKSLG